MSYIKKDGTVSPPSQLNPATKRRRAIGRRLAGFLEPIASVQQVADDMGLSPQTVRNIEEEALYKCAVEIRRIALEEEYDLGYLAKTDAAILEAT